MLAWKVAVVAPYYLSTESVKSVGLLLCWRNDKCSHWSLQHRKDWEKLEECPINVALGTLAAISLDLCTTMKKAWQLNVRIRFG